MDNRGNSRANTCMRVCVGVCVCVRACMCACVRVCARVCLSSLYISFCFFFSLSMVQVSLVDSERCSIAPVCVCWCVSQVVTFGLPFVCSGLNTYNEFYLPLSHTRELKVRFSTVAESGLKVAIPGSTAAGGFQPAILTEAGMLLWTPRVLGWYAVQVMIIDWYRPEIYSIADWMIWLMNFSVSALPNCTIESWTAGYQTFFADNIGNMTVLSFAASSTVTVNFMADPGTYPSTAGANANQLDALNGVNILDPALPAGATFSDCRPPLHSYIPNTAPPACPVGAR